MDSTPLAQARPFDQKGPAERGAAAAAAEGGSALVCQRSAQLPALLLSAAHYPPRRLPSCRGGRAVSQSRAADTEALAGGSKPRSVSGRQFQTFPRHSLAGSRAKGAQKCLASGSWASHLFNAGPITAVACSSSLHRDRNACSLGFSAIPENVCSPSSTGFRGL
ncbi:hypothetical protein BDY21DRAFT_22637 [Lineolata rhizophorae]|uniref:Uncharacterized protein n=1 Tax=Lineolata rhizophorae TaxID=578093 RepID=A0A6A6P2V7_9PEZI|nr:hypothetical protein BDY21DRAFT_22637 [Lineolata rhizophorae]